MLRYDEGEAMRLLYVRITFLIFDDDTLVTWISSLLFLTRNCDVNKFPAYMNQYPAHLTHEYAEERRSTVTRHCKAAKSVGKAVEMTKHFKISERKVHALYLKCVQNKS